MNTEDIPLDIPLKVQLGSGGHRPHGWRNLEQGDADIREVLPFADETVDALLAEHVITQVTIQEAYRFFQEAWRVLKPGGILRLAFPCPAKLMSTCTSEYLQLCQRSGWGDGTLRSAVAGLIFENGNWSVWSRELLESVLQSLGWRTMVQPTGMSLLPELRNAECHGSAVGWWNNAVESVVIEAAKGAEDGLEADESGEKPSSLVTATFGAALLLTWPGCGDRQATVAHLDKLGITWQEVESLDRHAAHAKALRIVADGGQEAGLVLECGLQWQAGFASMLDSAVSSLPRHWLALLLHGAGTNSWRAACHLSECEPGCAPHWRAYAVHQAVAGELAELWEQTDGSTKQPSWMMGGNAARRLFATVPDLVGYADGYGGNHAGTHWHGTSGAMGLAPVEAFAIIPTDSLLQEHPLPEHTRREALFGGKVSAGVIGWFNPAMMEHEGKTWLAYRTECRPLFRW